jgi:membrane protease subunit HflK
MYNTGILISRVNVENTQPPDNVRPAFDDVIRAREDEQRSQNQAQQYSNQIIPNARGEAQRQIEEANAYKERVIARAEGDASRFNSLLAEYSKAPEVTRQRLYIDSLQDVLSASSKVMIDVKGGNNMLYLPLDKIMEQNNSAPGGSRPSNSQEWQSFANELAPFLNGSSTNSVDRSRLNTNRGTRP